MAGRVADVRSRLRDESGSRSADAILIRQARLADLWSLWQLQRRCFEPGQAYGLPSLTVLYAWPRALILVACSDERQAGCIVADLHERQGRILNLCVDPDFRRRGSASTLMTLAEEILPTDHLALMVEDKNHGAQALYRKLGYLPVGDLRNYYGRNRHGILMEKRREAV